jgi:aconitate decarboxylase
MLNSSFIRGFELDDYHPLAPLHSDALVVPATLAVIPHVKRVSGPRFLLGAIHWLSDGTSGWPCA